MKKTIQIEGVAHTYNDLSELNSVLRDSDIVIGSNVVIGDHLRIGCRVMIDDDVTIDKCVFIGHDVDIYSGSTIGDFCGISDMVYIDLDQRIGQGCRIPKHSQINVNGVVNEVIYLDGLCNHSMNIIMTDEGSYIRIANSTHTPNAWRHWAWEPDVYEIDTKKPRVLRSLNACLIYLGEEIIK